MKQTPNTRRDDGNAFIPDTASAHKPMPADAESFAEEFIGSATGGEPVGQAAEDEVTDDEEGGPFLVLDEDARLPPTPDEGSDEREGREGREPVEPEQILRGARWAAKGA